MRKKKKSLLQRIYKKRRLYILIILIVAIVALCIWIYQGKNSIESATKTIGYTSELGNDNQLSEKAPEPEPDPEPELATGQTLVPNADGYTTTFTTLNSQYPKTYIEYKQNLGSWAENSYWGGTMTENGCGITAISIIASGYGSTITPEDLREKYYPHLDSSKIERSINSLGIECTEFYFDSSVINTKYISDWLKTGRPVLVCLDSSKENIWTEASHYMVILDINENGEFYISNPNGLDGTEKASGWYDPSEVVPHVAKILFIESYK